jgi:hypothetical protein
MKSLDRRYGAVEDAAYSAFVVANSGQFAAVNVFVIEKVGNWRQAKPLSRAAGIAKLQAST